MPELPEVETSRRGIEPHIIDTRITGIIIRNRHLRWPISKAVDRNLVGESITSVDRRAKYLLINTTNGTAILHLGMSGSVFMVDRDTPAGVHDHVDIEFDSGKTLRFRDPPRFGSLHWSKLSALAIFMGAKLCIARVSARAAPRDALPYNATICYLQPLRTSL